MRGTLVGLALVSLLASLFILPALGQSRGRPGNRPPEPPPPPDEPDLPGEGDPEVLALMHEINDALAEMGLGIAVQELEFFTIGVGRPVNRILQAPFRWVPNDPRRGAQGDDITYLVDQSDGATASGLDNNTDTEPAIDAAMSTWDDLQCMQNVDIVKRADPGVDPDIFDFLVCDVPPPPTTFPCAPFGDPGFPFFADIVHAGWMPPAFFDALARGGPGSGDNILAVSVTFIFVDGSGPTDINGDNYLDTALNEVYYNDGATWFIDANVDVETVALHESGHSLGLGHFGGPPPPGLRAPRPEAVMNPIYAGIRREPLATDEAGMCIVWGSWPQP